MNRLVSVLKLQTWLPAIVLAAFLTGCGGGGDDAPAPPPQSSTPPIGQISGDWAIVESAMTASDPACEPPNNQLANYTLAIAQDGSAITVTDSANPTTPTDFQGTLRGDQLTWSGSFPERGGVTTYDSVDITVAADCNTFSGTTKWTYVQDAPATFSCTGETTLTGAANNPDGCPVPAESSS
jgi:hypothetical protein